eukprot:CAMPEP_0170610258 /NCGR_PEP_ID=MMETSP0224-20130122/22560_1 /TAXON_ID=285029 /ORGANISM="Togula jolla, Strain CCCM 725" /LENGTH=279 /DNA_ID=CAMNT_0010935615 /DNA_START=44 /DNA_END=880 /DNA_ORIENTATION=+
MTHSMMHWFTAADLEAQAIPKEGLEGEPLDQRMYFVDYMPEYNFIPCACAKCGTTAMLNFVYSRVFGQDWPYDITLSHRDIHNIFSRWWERNGTAQFELVWDKERQAELMQSAFSLAIIRDPVTRLISSFKSKIQCRTGPGSGDPGRATFVKQLLELAGHESNATCLDLNSFAEALHDVHLQRKSNLLNDHFLPQNLGCFYSYPPEKWSKVVEINRPDTFAVLAGALRSPDSTPPESRHSSGKVLLTGKALRLLQKITRQEYAMLEGYLEKTELAPGMW